MAIISNNDRYEGSTSRMIGFGGDKLILDNRVMNSDMIQINPNVVDIPGHAQELLAGEYACFNNLMKPQKYTSNDYPIKPTQVDVSTDNPVFGKLYWTDPTKQDENYVKTNVYAPFGSDSCKMFKLSDKGNIILKQSINGMFGEIIDADEKYIYTMEYSSGHTNYLYWYDRKTLASQYVSWNEQYSHLIQVLGRTNENIFIFSPYNGKPYRHDKTATSSFNLIELTAKSEETKPLSAASSLTIGTINFTPKMKNGWHYRVAAFSAGANNPLTFDAVTIDTNALTYDTVQSANMEVVWNDQNCLEELKNYVKVGNTSYDNTTIFRTYKLSDTIFVAFKGPSTHNYSTLGVTKKTAVYVCQVDETKPNKVTVLRAKYFDYLYLEDIIRYDNDKFMFVQESVATHMYKFNYNTNDFTLSWNINTPNIVSCCYYNNVFWWLNGSTKELNYETETNTITIQDRFDVQEITLPDAETTGTANYYISVYNADEKRVEKNIKLECQGPGTFQNDLKEMTTTTSPDKDLEVPIKITTAGQFFINVTILS